MDREVARTPSTRWPFQLMTLPPASSIRINSSGLSGCVHTEGNNNVIRYLTVNCFEMKKGNEKLINNIKAVIHPFQRRS